MAFGSYGYNTDAGSEENIQKIKELRRRRKEEIGRITKEKYIARIKAARKVKRLEKIITLYKELLPIPKIASKVSMKGTKVKKLIRKYYADRNNILSRNPRNIPYL